MEFSEVIRKRYSCKKFDGRQVEKARLDAILEADRAARDAVFRAWRKGSVI